MAYSGPHYQQVGSYASGYFKESWRYRSLDLEQRSKPLPYAMSEVRSTGNWNTFGAKQELDSAMQEAIRLSDASYDRFWSKAYSRANVALTAIDAPTSLAMIAKRATQLRNAYRALKRGRFGDFGRELGLSRHPRWRSEYRRTLHVYSKPADAWLEFAFGWTPLVQDIFAAVDVLQQDFPYERIRVQNTLVNYGIYQDSGAARFATRKMHYFNSAWIKVSNPNLFLANQLGLTNPAYVAWDAVPFSFVVDWFLPVGKFLNSFSNSYGIETLDPVRGAGAIVTGTTRHGENFNNAYFPFLGRSCNRSLGLSPRPSFFSRLRVPNASPWLAATSVSLLIQQLRSR